MKRFKKLVAMIMALGIVSSMGISVYADTIGESQKTYYTGDVNLDGKVNAIDVILLKKMILGLSDFQKMYIDGDTLKLVEDTQDKKVTINATAFTVDTENNTIHITQQDFEEVLLDITLNVTYATQFYIDGISNLQELAEDLEYETIYISITYNSAGEIDTIEQVCYDSEELTTIFTGNGIIESYVYIYPEEKRVSYVFGDDLNKIDLNITDDTEITYNMESITVDELSEFMYADDREFAFLIRYNNTDNDIVELSILNVNLVPTSNGYAHTITLKDGWYELYIDKDNNLITIPELGDLVLQVTEDTIFNGITSLADYDETTHLNITYNYYPYNEITEIDAWKDSEIN